MRKGWGVAASAGAIFAIAAACSDYEEAPASADAGGPLVVPPSIPIDELPPGDASVPDASAQHCADGKPHDFCSTFDFVLASEDLADAGIVLDVAAGGHVASSREALSPPFSLEMILPAVPVAPPAIARTKVTRPWPRTNTNAQPAFHATFSIHIAERAPNRISLGSFILGAKEDPEAYDFFVLLATPDPESPTSTLLTVVEIDSIDLPNPIVTTNTESASVRTGEWTTLAIDVNERNIAAPGSVTITANGVVSAPVALLSKKLSPAMRTWIGLVTWDLAAASTPRWRVLVDDVMLDWISR